MQTRIGVLVLAISAACSAKSDVKPALPANAMASLPKADWPCARRELERSGTDPFQESTPAIQRFHYTEADACLLPMELVVEGIVGCAAQIDTYQPNKATYAGDRLVALDQYTVQWTADAVHEVGHTVARTGPKALECHRGDGTLHWRLQLDDAGRPVHETSFGKSGDRTESHYTWQGKRLTRTEISTPEVGMRFEMIYDCKQLSAAR